jgi:hypothetical protein
MPNGITIYLLRTECPRRRRSGVRNFGYHPIRSLPMRPGVTDAPAPYPGEEGRPVLWRWSSCRYAREGAIDLNHVTSRLERDPLTRFADHGTQHVSFTLRLSEVGPAGHARWH